MPTKTKLELQLLSAQKKLEKQKLKAKERLEKLKLQSALKVSKTLSRVKLSADKKVSKLKQKGEKKTKKQLMRQLWKLISPIVRNKYLSCYTCDKELPYKLRSAGHFWSKGGHPSVRFDLDNLRTQCDDCNRFKSGNCAEYAVRLQDELGYDKFQNLRLKAGQAKVWQRQELEQLIEFYKAKEIKN